MIKIRRLCKNYDTVRALNNLNLTIHSGELLGLVGANGAGKSTLLRCLVGLLKPDSGEINFSGPADLKEWELKEQIGYAPEEPVLYP